MNTTNHEYHIMQLSDSFFPSGIFSMSEGLESLVYHNKISNWKQVLKFIKLQIEFQLFPCDCAVLEIIMRNTATNDLQEVVQVDNKYYSMKLAKEVRNSSVRSGKQVFNCMKQMISKDNRHNDFVNRFDDKIKSNQVFCVYPVALGIASVCLDVPIQSATRMLLYSFSSAVASAAIRLGVIQHLDSQKILTLLGEYVNNISSQNNKEKTIDDIWQITPQTEIYQMVHGHTESRMFIT